MTNKYAELKYFFASFPYNINLLLIFERGVEHNVVGTFWKRTDSLLQIHLK